MKRFLLISLAFVFVSCGGSDGKNADQVLLDMEAATAEDCPEGGVEIFSGIDLNQDGLLNADEITDSQIICNGEDGTGEDGNNTLFLAEDEPEGANCPYGGKALHYGLDNNENGMLDSDEIEGTTYVCNGAPGEGLNSLISVMDETAGSNCTYGGQAILTGLDDDSDGLLQPTEVDSTVYVCNGASGYNSLVRQEDEVAGTNCAHGGKAVHSGLDIDGNDYLDPGEIQNTSYVCNGADGADGYNNLFEMQVVTAGAECPNGGQLLSTGLDINSNNTLDASEFMNQSYICNGEDGTDGYNSLVDVSDIAPGFLCTNGGQLIETGLDLDDNGTLDATEVTSTQTLCNGEDGHDSLLNVTEITSGTTCLTGGQLIESGLDLDDSGTLDATEVTSTQTLCNGEDGGMEEIQVSNSLWGGVCPSGGLKVETGVDADNSGILEPGEITNTQYVCNLVIQVAQVATGLESTCLLLTTGKIYCKGMINDYTFVEQNGPLATVVGADNAVDLDLGDYYGCFTKPDGTAWCWGYNYYGQLGDGSYTDQPTPVQVDFLTSVASISAGGGHTCAAKSDGTAGCWGNNEFGQLGDNSGTMDQTTPVQVNSLTSVASISAGDGHTCAAESDGTAWCWGDNYYGQLGDGSGTMYQLFPVKVDSLTSVASISVGWGHTCAAKSDGTAWCWGYNEYGQLGDGSYTDQPTPVWVYLDSVASSISAGDGHTCAINPDGTVWCWGYNEYGQLGDGSYTDQTTPVEFIIDIQELSL
ncbi:MAG: hypothetical protein PF689_00380 [Deltaproteobacteria bacterium]|nr:hypothetical protein [Deltaproteobacteria bacterium]